MTVAQLLAGCGLPRPEGRALLAHRLGVARERLIAHPSMPVDEADAAAFRADAQRRLDGEPLAYLLGEKEFYGRSFIVAPDVLVPRPETELLIDLALERLRSIVPPARVLDLGTGSGCIAVTLALEHPGMRVTATDASAAALVVARRNADQHGAEITFRQGDWYGALPADAEFDVIVANPPYVAPGDPHLEALRFEPVQALIGGGDGLACLRVIVGGAPLRLAPGGWLIVEHGYDQAAAVQALFERASLRPESHLDRAGQPRVTLVQRSRL